LAWANECSFFFKTPEEGSLKFHWTLVVDDASGVPWITTHPWNNNEQEIYLLVVKVKILEQPTTTILYCLEGIRDDSSYSVKINKPGSQITLLEVKNNFPGPCGVFLFRTPDPESHHWTVVVGDFGPVPFIDDRIVVQVKMKGKKKSVVELHVEGDPDPCYFRLCKDPTEVTLTDIKGFYGGPSGIFFFKTEDGNDYCWVLCTDDTISVPRYKDDSIICKVKPVKKM